MNRRGLLALLVLFVATAAWGIVRYQGEHVFDIVNAQTTLKIGGTAVSSTAAELNILDGVTATASELNTVDVTAGTATASKALVLDSSKDIASLGAITAGQYRVTNGSTLTAAASDLTKATVQASGYFPVDTSSNAVDVEISEALDAGDVGSTLIFAVATGHATQALTVTADGSGVTTVVSADVGAATCEDAGDTIRCVVVGTQTINCITNCAD